MKITKTTHLQIVSREDDIKRVAITCRCGTRFVTEVPTFIYIAAACGDCVVLCTCAQCGQVYRSFQGHISRCTNEFDEIPASILQTGASPDTVVDTNSDVTIKATWQMPASNDTKQGE